MKKAFVVVDMVKDFMQEDGVLFCGEQAFRVVQPIKDVIDTLDDNDVDIVIFVSDSHAEDDAEFELYDPHAITGTKGAELIDELSMYTEKPNVYFVDKTRFSAFHDTNLLENMLDFNNIDTIELAGVCTDICILATAIDAITRGYKVNINIDHVDSFDPDGHVSALLHILPKFGVNIIGNVEEQMQMSNVDDDDEDDVGIFEGMLN